METGNLNVRLRPRYHFLPRKNWMNDPNGTIYYKGEHHLFYQYNPNAAYWDDMHWGHAKSRDLVHWEELPIALAPSPELGERHCFSGCCVIDGERPVIYYTSVGEFEGSKTMVRSGGSPDAEPVRMGAQQWMAVGSDDLLTWTKIEGNPALSTAIHGGHDVVDDWRDPFIWKEQDGWHMVLAGTHKHEGCIWLYRSADLSDWQLLGKLYAEDRVILECPNVVKFGDKYLLIYSVIEERAVKFCYGPLSPDKRLIVERQGYLDGPNSGYYATNISIDGDGRVLLWGWINDAARGELDVPFDWSGIQSVPRVIGWSEERGLKIEPAKELETLRGRSAVKQGFSIGGETVDTGIEGTALDVEVTFRPTAGGTFGVKFLRSPDGLEETAVEIDPANKRVRIVRERSSASGRTDASDVVQTYRSDEPTVSLRLLIDQSAVEVLVNGESCLAARIYPIREDSRGLYLFAQQAVDIVRFQAWEMKPIG